MMQPYSTPFYFVILALLFLPLIIARLTGRKWMAYQVFITIGLLWLTFGGELQQLIALLAFGLLETLLVKGYLIYRQRANKSGVFYGAVILAILQLFIVKAWPVVSPQQPLSIVGFLGISYVTFKIVSTLMEIRDGLIKELSLKEFVYFLYFYPTISSGPIDRFRRFKKDLNKQLDPKSYLELLTKGVHNIFLGFLYNFIIGYFIQHLWLHAAARTVTIHPTVLGVISATYAYGFYLFFNFAGYSLFAIGVSQLMGIETPMNFNKPFLAKNIKDFWNRWHMTLCNWFRDFVFMRLVKTMMMKKFSKSMVTMSVIANLALFGLMGFWHGFAWYYIAYGFYHAGLMIAYEAWDRFKKKHKLKIPNVWWTKGLSIFITMQFVFLGFLIFSGLLNNMILYHATLDRLFIPNF